MRESGFKKNFPGLVTIREQLCRGLGLPTVPDSQEAAQAILHAANTNHGESSTRAADAHMLIGFAHVEDLDMPEADAAFRRANAIYGEHCGGECLFNIGSIWALAHTNAYMVNFDLADELYEDAIAALSRLLGGGHQLTRACLTDYHQFLEGFAKDEDSADAVLFFLTVTAGADDELEVA
jgi:hypothetical protein